MPGIVRARSRLSRRRPVVGGQRVVDRPSFRFVEQDPDANVQRTGIEPRMAWDISRTARVSWDCCRWSRSLRRLMASIETLTSGQHGPQFA